MIEQKLKQLKTVFIICIVIAVTTFIADSVYTTSQIQSDQDYTTLERWCIILTLFGIFASLKLLHPKLSESIRKNPSEAVLVYSRKYYIRLFTLMAIYCLNIVCLHITSIKNFMFLAFITIFAMFLCPPSKQQVVIEDEGNIEDKAK